MFSPEIIDIVHSFILKQNPHPVALLWKTHVWRDWDPATMTADEARASWYIDDCRDRDPISYWESDADDDMRTRSGIWEGGGDRLWPPEDWFSGRNSNPESETRHYRWPRWHRDGTPH